MDKLRYSWIFVLFFLTFQSFGQKLETFLDSSNAEVGELRKYTVVLHSPTNQVYWQSLKDTICKGLEIVGLGKIDTILQDNGFVFSQVYTVMAFDTGYYLIHPFKINIGDSIVQSNPNLLRVDFVKVDESADIKDIANVWDAPFIWEEIEEIFWWSLFFILLGVLVFLGIRYWLKIKKLKNKKTPKIIIHPYDFHCKKIADLENQNLWQNGKEKEYQTEVSYILRSILEHKFDIPVLEETTQNIMHLLKPFTLTNDLTQQIQSTLNFADFVKYAKGKGMAHQHEKAMELLKNLVELLKEKDAE
jgi:hypothetical protein